MRFGDGDGRGIHASDGIGQGRFILAGDEEVGKFAGEYLAGAGGAVDADHGRAQQQRFDERAWQPFGVRGQDQGLGMANERIGVGLVAGQDDALGEPHVLDHLAQPGFFVALALAQQDQRGRHAAGLVGAQQAVMTLAGLVGPDIDQILALRHRRRFLGQAQEGLSLVGVVDGANLGGPEADDVEQIVLDALGDGDDIAPGIEAVHLGECLGALIGIAEFRRDVALDPEPQIGVAQVASDLVARAGEHHVGGEGVEGPGDARGLPFLHQRRREHLAETVDEREVLHRDAIRNRLLDSVAQDEHLDRVAALMETGGRVKQRFFRAAAVEVGDDEGKAFGRHGIILESGEDSRGLTESLVKIAVRETAVAIAFQFAGAQHGIDGLASPVGTARQALDVGVDPHDVALGIDPDIAIVEIAMAVAVVYQDGRVVA